MSGSFYLIHKWLSCHQSESRLDKKRLNLYFSFLFRGILSIQLRDGVTVQLGRACYNKIKRKARGQDLDAPKLKSQIKVFVRSSKFHIVA